MHQLTGVKQRRTLDSWLVGASDMPDGEWRHLVRDCCKRLVYITPASLDNDKLQGRGAEPSGSPPCSGSCKTAHLSRVQYMQCTAHDRKVAVSVLRKK